jgi:N6-adenosine-specific RNA methylase IME4
VKRYRTIVADPPWHYDGFATTGGPGTVRAGMGRREAKFKVDPLPYGSMAVEEIAALEVGELAAPSCRLFLWATQRYLPHAFRIMGAWGFEYRQTLVWHKLSCSPFGGSIAPNNVEFVLVGVTGSPGVLERAKGCLLATPGNTGRRKGFHSRKPDCWLDYIEQVSPGPYLELFARRGRVGWDYWGDESLGTAEMPQEAA